MDQSKAMLEPATKMNTFAISSLEKTIKHQMDTMQEYSSLSFDQLKSAGGISKAEDLREYANSQVEFSGNLYKKILEDSKKLTGLGMELKSDFEALVEETKEVVSAAAAPIVTSVTKGKATAKG